MKWILLPSVCLFGLISALGSPSIASSAPATPVIPVAARAAVSSPLAFLRAEPVEGTSLDPRRSGCCSHHSGVCGCSCCDGSPLSAVCYDPNCGGGGTAPAAPYGLSGNPISPTQIGLDWVDNSSNETSFRIDMRTSGTIFQPVGSVGDGVTSTVIGGLSPSTSYIFRVIASNSYGDSSPSGELGVTTPALPQTAPAAPYGLSGSAASAHQIRLDWVDNSSDETGFRIEARTVATSFQSVGSVGAGVTSTVIGGLSPGTSYIFHVLATNASGDSSPSSEISVATAPPAQTCAASNTVLCLNGGRFKVEATYLTSQGQSGSAQVVELTGDTGYLWFFSPSNVEVVVKVLDGCAAGGHYWVFAGGLTNVAVTLKITDAATGAAQIYTNPQGKAFAPIQDTNAFADCP
jgi:hypothetical protein